MTTNSTRSAPSAVSCLGQDREALCLRGPEGKCTLGDLFRAAANSRSIIHADAGLGPCVPGCRSSPIMSTRRGSISSMPTCRSPRSPRAA